MPPSRPPTTLLECAGSPQFTPLAFDDLRVVHDDPIRTARSTRERIIRFCPFIDPELARVVIDEPTATQRGSECR